MNKLVGFTYNKGDKTSNYIYRRNLQGDIIGIYDSLGNEVGGYAYDAYGKCYVKYKDNSSEEEKTILNTNPFRYRGYYYDNETGLYYLNARYYDPSIGRFISPDVLSILDETKGQINGLNLYMYCNNNPIMYVDPSGCFAISALIIGAIIGICIGLGAAAYLDSKDGQMFNGDIKWYDYLGAAVLGGIIGEGIGIFATTTFTASIPVFGLVNSGGVVSSGIVGSTTLAISSVQVLEAVGTIGLTIIMSKSIGKYGGYEVKHNCPNDHYPPHVHIYGDDIHKGSHGIRIGLDGKPLKGEPPLLPWARKAIKKLMDAIAKALLPWKG